MSSIDLSGDGGVIKEIYQEGAGETPPEGYEIRAHYTGTLLDGTKFDSSRDRNAEFKVRVLLTMCQVCRSDWLTES
ncbi:hypothetical protein P43SY_011169 [Pythium insidiosum]|uniref:peptidylprolyl isomerase n=1 Tax=Pythium insidiosum TaxID=114742 RepID=A0AAD5L413_PYTIN|nr:hypothetical protein P43SY_011169 [Pythium insidiosum]